VTDDVMRALLERIRASADMRDKAEIAGLAHAPVEANDIVQSCENCIYFLAAGNGATCPNSTFPSMRNGIASYGVSEDGPSP